jgi:hypothetical protein
VLVTRAVAVLAVWCVAGGVHGTIGRHGTWEEENGRVFAAGSGVCIRRAGEGVCAALRAKGGYHRKPNLIYETRVRTVTQPCWPTMGGACDLQC